MAPCTSTLPVVKIRFGQGRWNLYDKDGTFLGDYGSFEEANDTRRFMLLSPAPFTLSPTPRQVLHVPR